MTASSAEISPGCASMSTCSERTAARFVPGSTGSTTVSPWTLTTTAPSALASLASRSMSSLGQCVISTPGSASTSHRSDAALQSVISTLSTISMLPGPTWSVTAITR